MEMSLQRRTQTYLVQGPCFAHLAKLLAHLAKLLAHLTKLLAHLAKLLVLLATLSTITVSDPYQHRRCVYTERVRIHVYLISSRYTERVRIR